jgi:L-ascorbate metabolism protein UlaG (beta-lactamase superfamily)
MACSIDQLPHIDVVLLSHDHYDHLEASAIENLSRHSPGVVFFAPLGVAGLVRSWGYDRVIEFDWRQTVVYRSIEFFCMPARHHGIRYGFDRGSRLWCSWLIKSDVIVYFPGDSAIGPHFAEVREIAERPIDLALMPLGPSEPKWMMRRSHLDARDVFAMAQVLQARRVYPIHWGCFALGQKPEISDITQLRLAWSGENLEVLRVGEFLEWEDGQFVLPERLRAERGYA